MTTQHTPGRLKVQRPYAGERGWEIAFEPGLEQVCQNVTEANARRLVAAWNACEGISTESLESAGNAFNGWRLASYALDDAKAQRDELLDALKDLAQSIVWKEFGECRGFSDSMPLPVITAVEKARAAIAKATGEQE